MYSRTDVFGVNGQGRAERAAVRHGRRAQHCHSPDLRCCLPGSYSAAIFHAAIAPHRWFIFSVDFRPDHIRPDFPLHPCHTFLIIAERNCISPRTAPAARHKPRPPRRRPARLCERSHRSRKGTPRPRPSPNPSPSRGCHARCRPQERQVKANSSCWWRICCGPRIRPGPSPSCCQTVHACVCPASHAGGARARDAHHRSAGHAGGGPCRGYAGVHPARRPTRPACRCRACCQARGW